MSATEHIPKETEAAAQEPDSKPREDRLTAASRTLPRRRFFDDMPDRGLFAVVLIGGFVAIILLKTATQVPAVFVMAGAVAAMILYGAVAYRLPLVGLRPDRLGDNLYYLGFIYTLASLSAALLQLQAGSGVDELLGNFGIALITTVAGVAGRVLFAQMRGDIDEVEDRVRRDLMAASADLRSQLVGALREFETFQKGVLQAASEAMQTMAAETQENIKKMADAGTEKVNEAVADSHRQAELLANMLMRINKVISELPLMGKLELPNERLEKQIASLAAEVEALVEQLRYVTGVVAARATPKRRRWYWLYLR
jgi:hypothetical protein